MSLIRSLQHETEAVSAFAGALAEEREAMKSGDFAALSTLLERKTALARALADMSAAREAQMRAAGIRADASGQLVGLRIDPAVTLAWRDLRLAAQSARDASELNGAVINAHLEFTSAALHTLRQRGTDAGLYGRNGRAEGATPGVSLACG